MKCGNFWTTAITVALLSASTSGQTIEHSNNFADETTSENHHEEDSLSKQAKASIIRLTNEFRQKHNLSPVETNPALEETARYFAHYMARTNKFGHQADGNSPAQRAKDHGYEYCVVLENIAYRYRSTGFEPGLLGEGFFTGWRDSPEHRQNMLDPSVTQTGLAVAEGERKGLYFAVQMFGRPESARIKFQIRNASSETIHYVLSGRGFENSYELPRGALRVHRVCRSLELKLMRDEQPQTIQVTAGAEYVVEEEGGELTVHPVASN